MPPPLPVQFYGHPRTPSMRGQNLTSRSIEDSSGNILDVETGCQKWSFGTSRMWSFRRQICSFWQHLRRVLASFIEDYVGFGADSRMDVWHAECRQNSRKHRFCTFWPVSHFLTNPLQTSQLAETMGFCQNMLFRPKVVILATFRDIRPSIRRPPRDHNCPSRSGLFPR